MRRFSQVLVLACVLSSSVGCATMPAVRLDQGCVQTKLQDLEADVLDDAKKFRQLLEDSGAVYDDPALQAYLDRLFQPLVPTLTTPSPYQFRLKVVRDPTLNAYTLGDGSIYVNTGLIARLQTAQQLAFVLGHELAHVMTRDLVYFTDSLRRKTVAAKLTGLVVTPALSVVGLGGLGELGVGLAYAASVTGYGREREALADAEGLKTMQRLDGTTHLRAKGRYLACVPIPKPVPHARPRPLEVARPDRRPTWPLRPASTHPWRRSYQTMLTTVS